MHHSGVNGCAVVWISALDCTPFRCAAAPLLTASLNKRGKWGHASVEPHTQAPDDEMNRRGGEREDGWELQRRQQENGEETQF